MLEEGGYEVEWRDMRRHDHELTVHQDIGRIAKDLTIWMAGRNRRSRRAPAASDSRVLSVIEEAEQYGP
jgi:hypothetical protein